MVFIKKKKKNQKLLCHCWNPGAIFITLLCACGFVCASITSIHVIHGAQHVVRCAGQAADAQTAVGALVARVSAAREQTSLFLRTWSPSVKTAGLTSGNFRMINERT